MSEMKRFLAGLRSRAGVIKRACRAFVNTPEATFGAFLRHLFLPTEAPAGLAGTGILIPPAISADIAAMRDRYGTRKGFILADLISRKLPTEERFTILDGGAREALSDPRWQIFEPNRVRLYGFEPDEDEVKSLNEVAADRGLDYQYFPGALWGSPAEITFYENKSPGGGSCFPQNTDLTHRWKFQNQQDAFMSYDIFYPTGTSQWQSTTLDAWAEQIGSVDIDFMKLNVQGAELEILKGGESLLPNVIGVMAEVSFVESYRKRPFFSDTDAYLRSRGFEFFDLIGLHYMGRSESEITASHLPGLYPLWGQLIEAHGIYFKDPIRMEQEGGDLSAFTPTKVFKLVAFAEVFGQIEYAFELLKWQEKRLRQDGQSDLARQVEDVRSSGAHLYKTLMV